MDIQELKQQFENVARQVQKQTESQPALGALMSLLISLFSILLEQFTQQTEIIAALQQKLADRTLSSKRGNDENINGPKSERRRGVNSANKDRDKDILKSAKTQRRKSPRKRSTSRRKRAS